MFKDKFFMTNQCLNKKFILLVSSLKFISLNKFFIVRKKMTFLRFLIRNNYSEIISKRIKSVFLLFEENNEKYKI
jgi:hypothetical protein